MAKSKDERIRELEATVADQDQAIASQDQYIQVLTSQLAAAAPKLVELDRYRQRHIEELQHEH